jgi:O-antigen/teichoic acid export membrane protein
MLKRYFLSNIALLLFLNLLVKPAWVFVIDRNVQLTVGHTDYGLYSALSSLTIMFNILLDLGITNFNNRNLAADRSNLGDFLPNMIAAKLLLSGLYFVVIAALGLSLDYSGRAFTLMMGLALVQSLNSFLLFLRSNVSAHHDYGTDSLLSVLDKLLMIGVCGILLFLPLFQGQFRLEWFLYAQMGCYLITILVGLFIVARRYSRIRMQQVSLQTILGLSRKSLPYALLILLMGVYMRSDSLMLERLEGPVQNSYYAATYRILDMANMSGFLFAGILLPLFTRLITRNMAVDELVQSSMNILLSLSLGLLAFSLAYSEMLMRVLYPDDFSSLTDLYRLTMGSFPAFCLMYIYATLLTAHGEIGLLLRIAGFGAALALTLNYLLIKAYHAEGAAMASLTVEWSMALTFLWFAYRKGGFSLSVGYLSKQILLFFGLLGLSLLLLGMGVNLFPAMGTTAIGFVLLVYGLGLWNRRQLSVYLAQIKPGR